MTLDITDVELGITPALAEPGPTARPVKKARRPIPARVVIGGGFAIFLVLVAILAPLIAPHDPLVGSLNHRLEPMGSPGHLLGTDGQGRDLLSRLIWGTRPTLIASVTPVLVAAVIGTFLGVLAGLGRRFTETVVMRCLDILFAFPGILLAIAIAAALGPGTMNTIIALTVVLIPSIARIVQSEVAGLRSLDFMEAARASGARWPSIAVRQVLPNLMPTLLIYCSTLLGLSIVFSAGLSFLGLGVTPPAPEWGQILNDLRQNLYDAPILSLAPAVLIFITAMALNMLGDGLRDYQDVRGTR